MSKHVKKPRRVIAVALSVAAFCGLGTPAAFAQARTDGPPPSLGPVTAADSQKPKTQIDPCALLRPGSPLRLGRCDGNVSRMPADDFTGNAAALPFFGLGDAAADGPDAFTALRAPNTAGFMVQPAYPPRGDIALLASPPRDSVDTIIVIGRRPDYSAVERAYLDDLESRFGNQPSTYDQFEDALTSPVGRFAATLVAGIGLGGFSGRAEDAAKKEIRDQIADLIIGRAQSGGDPMQDPIRARDDEWFREQFARQRGIDPRYMHR